MNMLVNLGDYSETIMGQAPPGSDCNKSGEGTPFVKAGEFRQDRPIIREWTTNPLKMAEKDDILICVVGATSGKINRGENCAIGRSVAAVRANKRLLDVNYLYFFLKSWSSRLLEMSQGAAQTVITKSMIHDLKIPLPLNQQKKIAAILDAADAYRQKTKALIEKYDELTQSLFLDMFGDPVTNPRGYEKINLGDISHMKAGKFVKAVDIKSEENPNLHSCYGGNGLRGYVESFTHEGEFLLIGRQGALCGNVKIVNGKFHATEHAVVCSPIMKYESLWLYHMLVMINLNKYATGAAQPGLNVGTLVELEVVFPPNNLQCQFAERVQAIEAQKAQAVASLAQAEDLFNSLLQRAFKGELTS